MPREEDKMGTSTTRLDTEIDQGVLSGTAAAIVPPSLIAHTGSITATGGGSGDNTTPAVDTTGASLLVVAISYFNGAVHPVPDDSKGNTWVPLTEYLGGSGNDIIRVFYVKNPTVGSGHTFHTSGVSSFNSMVMAAFNQTDRTANAQNDVGAGSNGASQQPGSITPPTSNSLVISALEFFTNAVPAIDSGFTLAHSVADPAGTVYCCAIAYKNQGAAAAVNPTWTVAGGRLTAIATSFKHG